ncbi:MAG: hypothetical protein QF726_00435 [Alphaproteobacteria bacterium]|nr:hypothetical protein [Alphaproteobacteria bacterium]
MGGTAFWNFFLAVRACDTDVNMLQFCRWIGASGSGPLASDDFRHLCKAVSV